MRLIAAVLALLTLATPAQAREVVDASVPQGMSVTLYRDPARGTGEAMNRNWPQGFAMISETRTVTLPPGESTVRFEGVAEGMVGVTAIVTARPGGRIEKNRKAELLGPAALVNGALGNRVTITRPTPATRWQECRAICFSWNAVTVPLRVTAPLVTSTFSRFKAGRARSAR
mgnify:CR=1 FL=1